MKFLLALIILIALFFICLLALFRKVFYVDRKSTLNPGKIADTKQHRMFREKIEQMIEDTCALPCEEVRVESFDGLSLFGRLYLQSADAPFEILFHGYRDNAISDFCGGLKLALSLGHNVILVDQRAHGRSEGKCLSFGILERKDVLSWLDFIRRNYGSDTPVFLMGISMGAATVLMASDLDITPNVRGIIADCGYSSPQAIIRKVAGDMKYPKSIVMPLIKLSAKIFGGFDLCEASAVDALRNAKVPVLFIHSYDDSFVPYSMSIENYEACISEKYLLSVPEADHGMSFLFDKAGYTKAVTDFVCRMMLQ